MERRYIAIDPDEITIEERDGNRQLMGYASVFYNRNNSGTQYQLFDKVYERIMPTAFDKVLADSPDTRALINHDPNLVLGRTTSGTLKLGVFSKGLRYIINPPNTTAANDLITLIRRGDISGASFAFSVRSDGQIWTREGENDIREIHSVDSLSDVSIVTYPAYTQASAGMRTDDIVEARSSHDAWRKELADQLAERDAEIARLQQRALRVKAECVA